MAVFLELLLLSGLLDTSLSYTVEASCPKQLRDNVDDRYLQVYDGQCFYFATFGYETYPEANATCRELGGTLAIPKTREINEFLKDEVARLEYFGPLWIGMHDIEEEGNYIWEDGSPVDWTNFDSTTGVYIFGGHKEDCITFDPMYGSWHDYRCDTDFLWRSPHKGYICQYPGPTEVQASAGDKSITNGVNIIDRNGTDFRNFSVKQVNGTSEVQQTSAGDKNITNGQDIIDRNGTNVGNFSVKQVNGTSEVQPTSAGDKNINYLTNGADIIDKNGTEDGNFSVKQVNGTSEVQPTSAGEKNITNGQDIIDRNGTNVGNFLVKQVNGTSEVQPTSAGDKNIIGVDIIDRNGTVVVNFSVKQVNGTNDNDSEIITQAEEVPGVLDKDGTLTNSTSYHKGGESTKASETVGFNSTTKLSDEECPPFICGIDCGMSGFALDEDNCTLCECSE